MNKDTFKEMHFDSIDTFSHEPGTYFEPTQGQEEARPTEGMVSANYVAGLSVLDRLSLELHSREDESEESLVTDSGDAEKRKGEKEGQEPKIVNMNKDTFKD
eukprot:6342852-Alexandrium_andersonii.AAC.1